MAGFRSVICTLASGLILVCPAMAHRVGIPVTTIEWNDRTDVWEVSHQVSAHDFEPFMIARGVAPEVLYETPGGQRAIGQYLLESFIVQGVDAPLSLSFIGAEADRDIVWIYFELESPDQAVAITNSVLLTQDAPDQSYALVNIKSGAGVETLIFQQDDGAKRSRLIR